MKNDTARLARTLRMKLKLNHHPTGTVLRITSMLSDEELVKKYHNFEKLKLEGRVKQ